MCNVGMQECRICTDRKTTVPSGFLSGPQLTDAVVLAPLPVEHNLLMALLRRTTSKVAESSRLKLRRAFREAGPTLVENKCAGSDPSGTKTFII